MKYCSRAAGTRIERRFGLESDAAHLVDAVAELGTQSHRRRCSAIPPSSTSNVAGVEASTCETRSGPSHRIESSVQFELGPRDDVRQDRDTIGRRTQCLTVALDVVDLPTAHLGTTRQCESQSISRRSIDAEQRRQRLTRVDCVASSSSDSRLSASRRRRCRADRRSAAAPPAAAGRTRTSQSVRPVDRRR